MDILIPFFRAGLENNELCVWATPETLDPADARKAMEKTVPRFGSYDSKGQMEIIPSSQWHARGGKSGKAIVSKADKAVSRGFDGLRLACCAVTAKGNGKVFSCYGTDAVCSHNVIAVFSYPRDKFDAAGLMEVVKNHRAALVRNAGRWEAIESSEAHTVRDALKRTEEKLQSLFSNMSEGFAYHRIVLDEKGRPCDYVFLEVNGAFERLTGLKEKTIRGRRVTQVLPGIDKDPTDWIGKYGKVALTGKPVKFESYSEALHKWYSVSAFSPHKGYFAVTISDITEQKLAEESLIRAKEEWELTFDSVPDMIAILDNRHRIMRVNQSMAQRLGFTPQECVGLPCYKFVHGTSAPPPFCPHSRTLCDGTEHVEEIHEDKLGADLLVSTTPLRDRQGQMIGSVHVAHDITERKKAEKRITALNEQLRQKIEELSAANDELEAFSYSVSHDLRAPLRSVDGFSQEILEDYGDKLDENGVDSLRRIRAASQRMGLLIDGLLNLSRLSRSEIVRTRVDLSTIANDILENLRKNQAERKVDVVIAKGMVEDGDERLLYVVLQNLLGNAWKFTRKVPEARLEFGAMKKNDKTVYYVRDNGAGFDMAQADRLFKPFQRLHDAADFSGSGIGLATVQRIIHRHGGRIWAEGKVGKGTAFYFTLK